MLTTVKEWLGFSTPSGHSHGAGGHSHGEAAGHGHTHGVVDPNIASSERGIWAIKWSFVILAISAILQLIVVFYSGSVALLADTIHNVGDAVTAIPLWIAFVLVRRKPTSTFNYGLGRVEDLAGMVIVLIILFSALVAGYEAVSRLFHPQPITQLLAVAVAGVVGFIGNEVVAIFRIKVGREMNSAALIADGYHARTDGLTSLAVVLGAVGVWFGFPLADPIIGLMITIAIFGIVWQSARAVITRSLDGVDPSILAEIRHAAEHVPGVEKIADVKARWIGHRLHADVTIAVDHTKSVAVANGISLAVQEELRAHLAPLGSATIQFGNHNPSIQSATTGNGHAHHHAPDPFPVKSSLASGLLQIIDTPDGERMLLTLTSRIDGLKAVVEIARSEGVVESLELFPSAENNHAFQSSVAPAEPHEFDAVLKFFAGDQQDILAFHMSEPEGHHH